MKGTSSEDHIQPITMSLLLITGATGQIGYGAVIRALQAGYRVRAAVRSQEKADVVLSASPTKELSLSSDQLSFVVVPDLSVAGAYDEAMRGIQGIIHTAGALAIPGIVPAEEFQDFFVDQVVNGNTSLLESAKKSGTVKRVVVLSSISVIIPYEGDIIGNEDQVFDSESFVSAPAQPYRDEMHAYSAGKIKVHQTTAEWLKKNEPGFDVAFINPPYVLGRDPLKTTAKEMFAGSNSVPLCIALGIPLPGKRVNCSVHRDDVTRALVGAVNPESPAETYMVCSSSEGSLNASDWNRVPDIIAKEFPDAVKSGSLPSKCKFETVYIRCDASKAEKAFGFRYISFEEQIREVVGAFLEMSSKEAQ